MNPETDLLTSRTLPKILVVDDDSNFLFGVSRMLVKAGFDVIPASDGPTGIMKAQNEQPDLILLDVNMPRMNGFQVKQALNISPLTQFIPTVFLTAMGDRINTLNGLNLGQDYISKPFDAEILTARIKAILQRAEIGYLLAIQDSKKNFFATDRFQQWGQTVEIHDYGTAGHTQRVTCWFTVLARALGLTGADLENARKGAMLHDIGKLAVPENILNKPGPLNEKEWEIMQQHPVIAVKMLKEVELLQFALDIPHYHHEHWDGSGYPNHLAGDAIPLSVRIFSLVDVFDALCTKRPYKTGMEVTLALEMIADKSGSHFDPAIVRYFLSNFDTIKKGVTDEYIQESIGNR